MNSTEGLDAAHEKRREARHVDQDIALRAQDEIAGGAEGCFGSETAEAHLAFDGLWKGVDGGAHVVPLGAADRPDRASDESAHRRLNGRRILGLDEHGRLFAGATEGGRRDLPAEIAIDAGGIDEEIPGDVLGTAA
jgi:hypothetical protein